MTHDIHLAAVVLLAVFLVLPVVAVFVTQSIIVTIVAVITLLIAGGLWLLTRNPVETVLALALLVFLQWAFVPTGRVPHFRVQSIRIRLRLRLHPGHGFATASAIIGSLGPVRVLLGEQANPPGPDAVAAGSPTRRSHSMFLGRAHYRLGTADADPGAPDASSGRLGRTSQGSSPAQIANYPGSVVSTSTKGDMVALTAGVRQHRGSQIYVFNPQGSARSTATSGGTSSGAALSRRWRSAGRRPCARRPPPRAPRRRPSGASRPPCRCGPCCARRT